MRIRDERLFSDTVEKPNQLRVPIMGTYQIKRPTTATTTQTLDGSGYGVSCLSHPRKMSPWASLPSNMQRSAYRKGLCACITTTNPACTGEVLSLSACGQHLQDHSQLSHADPLPQIGCYKAIGENPRCCFEVWLAPQDAPQDANMESVCTGVGFASSGEWFHMAAIFSGGINPVYMRLQATRLNGITTVSSYRRSRRSRAA